MQNALHAILVVGILFFIWPFPGSVHAHEVPKWVERSTNGEGVPCCGKNDCIRAPFVEVWQTGAGYADVLINEGFGVVYEHSVRTIQIDCTEDEPMPYVCVNRQFHNAQYQWFSCMTVDSDGNRHISINPACIRCINIPVCMAKYY